MLKGDHCGLTELRPHFEGCELPERACGLMIRMRGSWPDSRCSSIDGWRKVRAPQGEVPGNAWGARAYGKCHRKYTARALSSAWVRVKWCGKSAPRHWQQWWQGKPHSEQDQIGKRSGVLSRAIGEARPVLLPGRSLEACGDACPR